MTRALRIAVGMFVLGVCARRAYAQAGIMREQRQDPAYAATLRAIAEDIEALAPEYPQLAEFSVARTFDPARLTITYFYRTVERPQARRLDVDGSETDGRGPQPLHRLSRSEVDAASPHAADGPPVPLPRPSGDAPDDRGEKDEEPETGARRGSSRTTTCSPSPWTGVAIPSSPDRESQDFELRTTRPRSCFRMQRLAIVCLLACSSCMPPEWGANAILHPYRKPNVGAPDVPYEDLAFTGEGGIALRGWRFPAQGPRRGTLVYLHGIADNRAGGVGIAKRFGPKGWDVIAYDGRAHGASGQLSARTARSRSATSFARWTR